MYDNLELLDENEVGEKLYLLKNDLFETSILVAADGEEYCIDDMQGQYPVNFDEVPDYNWNNLKDVAW